MFNAYLLENSNLLTPTHTRWWELNILGQEWAILNRLRTGNGRWQVVSISCIDGKLEIGQYAIVIMKIR